ncbi:MAG: hypothetical protein J6L24_06370 [Oscillospiraceae bacterium]|nr:hypothetical protein [Oscillospiraceae bacterium]
MNCIKCKAKLKKNSMVCPKCGKDNTPKPWGKIGAICAVSLVLVVGLIIGIVQLSRPGENNLYCRDSYTAKTGSTYRLNQFLKRMDTVIAVMGDSTLTNSQLQAYYWMEVRLYLSDAEDNGWDAPNSRTSLAAQIYDSETGKTWQQFFLEKALNTWQEYQLLTLEAENAGFVMPEEYQAQLDSTEADLTAYAAEKSYASLQELLEYRLGEGGNLQAYVDYLTCYFTSTLYREKLEMTDEAFDALLRELIANHPMTVDYTAITLGTATFT